MGATVYIIFGILCLCAGLYFCIRPILPGSLFTYFGMWFFKWSHIIWIDQNTLIFWGIITLLVLGVNFLQRKEDSRFHLGNVYLLIGTIAGMLIGIALGEHFMVAAAWIGTIIAQFAFAKTPKGRPLLFSASNFISYFCAKGIHILIVVSMVGIIIEQYIK